MKRLFSRKPSVTTICLLAAALGGVIGTAYAACSPAAQRSCADARVACGASGTNPLICEFRYDKCMARIGCGPMP